MKNIKKYLFTVAAIAGFALSAINSMPVDSDISSNFVYEETNGSSYELLLCHDNDKGGTTG